MVKNKFLFFFICCLVCVTARSQTSNFKFDFGEGIAAKGYIKVTPATLFTNGLGYGFSGDAAIAAARTGSKGVVEDDYITSDKPFFFSVKLPEGNYHVKVTLGDAQGVSQTTIKAECRRLMVEKLETKKGRFAVAEFNVHVKDSIIRGKKESKVRLKTREHSYLHWDDLLTLEFNNSMPRVCAIEISKADKVTTLFLAGNSTVVDQSAEPWGSWGQMFPSFLRGDVCVANYAESGETMKDFKGSRRLDKLWSMAKPGDYLFVEFAHNDQKPGRNFLDPFTTYKATLKEWITEARKRKMTPVLVTSMNRRRFDSAGAIINTLGDYPQAMRGTGAEMNVTVLDLNRMSKTLFEAWGPAESLKAFVHFPANTFPGQTKALEDNTHFSSFGAYELAKCVVQAIKGAALPITKNIVPGFEFNPAKPDRFADFRLPASPVTASAKPDGN